MLSYPPFTGVQRLEDAARSNPYIVWGAQGPAIAKLQEAYVRLGYPMPKSTCAGGRMDGIFGSEMFAVTQKFQTSKTLKDDGIIGKDTMGALDAAMVATLPPTPKPKPKPVPKPKLPKPVPGLGTIEKHLNHDNYDLHLIRYPTGYELRLSMTIRFAFVDGPGASWASFTDKLAFVKAWSTAVETQWSTANVYTSPKHGRVPMRISIIAFMGPASPVEWQATVKKLPPGVWEVSEVVDGTVNTVRLDSNDLDWENKGGPEQMQDGVHEFGHMLGLPDENPASAPPGNPFGRDERSIMHKGHTVRQRHYAAFAQFVKDYFGE